VESVQIAVSATMPRGLAQQNRNSVVHFSNVLARGRSSKDKAPIAENLGETQDVEEDDPPLSRSQTASRARQQRRRAVLSDVEESSELEDLGERIVPKKSNLRRKNPPPLQEFDERIGLSCRTLIDRYLLPS
jgi:hypothetical protein